ncbi:hypothetical protein H312_00114, partial [Anncaliia algerae PRA339]
MIILCVLLIQGSNIRNWLLPY